MTKFVMTKEGMTKLIKSAREQKGLLIREVAQRTGIDQALISKYESGTRKPSRQHLYKLAETLNINPDTLIVDWLKEKILYDLGDDDSLALQAISLAEEEVKYKAQNREFQIPDTLKSVLSQIDRLKKELDQMREFDSYRIAQALELEYTFESNRIEGNTLTLKETDLVINEGLTISGKSMREHLEAINHKDAITYVKHLVDQSTELSEREMLIIHNLVLRGINQEQAGAYRNVQVMIKGSKHIPPAPYLVAKEMENCFIWYQKNKSKHHPVVLAAEMHERIVTIHPFIDGNGRTSRLIMNLILLKNGYVIANIKGDTESRLAYYNTLEQAQTTFDKAFFIQLVANYELEALQRYIDILKK